MVSSNDPEQADGTPGAAPSFRPRDLGIEDWVGIAGMVIIMLAMSAGVFFRYVLNDSLSWSEELARYGLVCMTFIGTSTAIRRRTHVRVDVIDLTLRDHPRRLLRLVMDLLCLLFLGYLCWRTAQLMEFLENSRSPAMQIPVNWVYGTMLAGIALAAVRQIVVIKVTAGELRR